MEKTTMQRGRVAGPVVDNFDMWHDYMSLGRMFEKLCSEEIEDGHTSSPQLRHVAGNRHQTCLPYEDNFCKNSIETETLSRTSSLSDTTHSLPSEYTCGFCKQNGESAEIYQSHRLRSRKGKLLCPILRNYTCPICGATGDFAHTRRYCPQVQRQDGLVLLGSKCRGTVQ